MTPNNEGGEDFAKLFNTHHTNRNKISIAWGGAMLKSFLRTILSPNTSDRYSRALTRIMSDLGDLSDLTPERLHEWLYAQNWGNSSQYVAFCAVKRYLRWRFGDAHPALALKFYRQQSPPQRVLSYDQAACLLALHDTTTSKGIRDLAICSLMLDSGLRVSEVCALSKNNLTIQECCFIAQVKGNRWERGVYSEMTALYLYNWLSIRDKIANPGVKECFVSIGGNRPGTKMTRDGLQTLFRYWGERLGFKLSPHDLRRTFAVLSTRNGAPARVLQVAGRWRSMDMVERYTQTITAEDFAPYFPVKRLMS